MGARADQVQVVDLFAAIVGTEPRALRQDRFHAEGGATKGRQAILEILWREHARCDDLVREAGQ